MPGVAFKTKLKRELKLDKMKQKQKWQLELEKPLGITVRQHLETLMDRIDPLELATIALTATIIKPIIETGPGIIENAVLLNIATGSPIGLMVEYFTGHLPFQTDAKELPQGQIVLWAISFVVAFMLVRHGGEIASAGISGIKGIVGLML